MHKTSAQFLHSQKQAIYLSINQWFLRIYSPAQDERNRTISAREGEALPQNGAGGERVPGILSEPATQTTLCRFLCGSSPRAHANQRPEAKAVTSAE